MIKGSTGKDTGRQSNINRDKSHLYDPWDNRSSDWNQQRHSWIMKNALGMKDPFTKSRYGGLIVRDPDMRQYVLGRYNKGVLAYDDYLASQQPPPQPDPQPPTDATPPTRPGGGSLWGGAPGSGGGGGSDPGRDPTVQRLRRFSSAEPYGYEFANQRLAGPPAERAPMRVDPRTQWSGNKAAEAINKWNEFQQRRAQAWAGVPQNQGTNQQGRSVQSRANLMPNQFPGLRQQAWGQTGGNLNSALMGAGAPYQGPKG